MPTPMKLVRDKAFQELMALLDKVHKGNKGLDEEEVT
jgi:hypothetical protein